MGFSLGRWANHSTIRWAAAVHLAAPPLGCTGADYVTEERRADKVGDDEEQRLCFKALQYSHKTDDDCPFHQDCPR
jgi:hypothetical protein